MEAVYLPCNTLCPSGITNPINGITTIRAHGEPIQLHKKKSGGYEVGCTACGKKHTRGHFRDNNPIAYEIFDKAINNKDNLVDAIPLQINVVESFVSIEPTGSSINIIESESQPQPAKRKPGRPAKPINEDEHILQFDKEKKTFIKTCDNIARYYQTLVDQKEKRTDKKFSAADSFRTLVWVHNHADANSAKCPVCLCNNIYKDKYTLGHIFPEVYGGKSDISNLMPICSGCNGCMADKHLYFWAWDKFKRILWNVSTF
jgi:5-methylcytosine-specific restriction endonuclease McrA